MGRTQNLIDSTLRSVLSWELLDTQRAFGIYDWKYMKNQLSPHEIVSWVRKSMKLFLKDPDIFIPVVQDVPFDQSEIKMIPTILPKNGENEKKLYKKENESFKEILTVTTSRRKVY